MLKFTLLTLNMKTERLTFCIGRPGVHQMDGLGLIVKCIWARRASICGSGHLLIFNRIMALQWITKHALESFLVKH